MKNGIVVWVPHGFKPIVSPHYGCVADWELWLTAAVQHHESIYCVSLAWESAKIKKKKKNFFFFLGLHVGHVEVSGLGGQIRAAAASLRHSNVGSLTHRARPGSNLHLHGYYLGS